MPLLQKKLQAEQIKSGWTETGSINLNVKAEDFPRARTVATNVISQYSLTVQISTDTNLNGYEIWKNGKIVGSQYF